MIERMTECCVSWKCFVACLRGDESQQPTWPQVKHSRSATHVVPSLIHSSQRFCVRGGGKLSSVRFLRCSHGLVIFSLLCLHFARLCWPYSKTSGDEESIQNREESLCSHGHESCRNGAFQDGGPIVE